MTNFKCDTLLTKISGSIKPEKRKQILNIFINFVESIAHRFQLQKQVCC